MFKNHPYQFVYFNKFAGKSVANYFELDYWGNSNRSALTFISKNDNRNNIKVYVFSNSPYHFSLLLMNKEDQNRIKFVNKLNEADYLVTNHFYIRNNPIILNNKLKEEYKLLKEFKVDTKPDETSVKVDEKIKGKVKTQKDKLRSLRKWK